MFKNANQKEVARYRDALFRGFSDLKRQKNIISNNSLISMFQNLKGTSGGFRIISGAEIRNQRTGITIYVPPQNPAKIIAQMSDLETYINSHESSGLDALVKMALIHHQFESIHPFPDGNGRIGRILNVLFLVQQGLLDNPILYLSRHITKTKDQYYSLLQSTRDSGQWEPWLLYIIDAVDKIAIETTYLISEIRSQMAAYKMLIGDQHAFYSQDLCREHSELTGLCTI